MEYTKENIQEGILNKISSLSCPDGDKRIFMATLPNYPKEIEQNILEWINDRPLTDIDCHGLSLSRILIDFNLDVTDIPTLVWSFIAFKNSNWRIPQKVWQTVSGLTNDR